MTSRVPSALATPLAVLAAAPPALIVPASVPASASARTFRVSSSADQLMIVSSPSDNPRRQLTTFRAYRRVSPKARWRRVFGPWPAEIGYGGLSDHRHEGDGSTPTGVYAIGARIYGNRPDPGGLHYAYHRLSCGDWWDEDPYSPRYNHFVHVACGVRPRFASGSEPLWTEPVPYPYLAVIRFNVRPTVGGRNARGSAIFLHSWVNGPTAGCVALPKGRLLAVLRWLRPTARPAIEIGTDREIGPIPPAR